MTQILLAQERTLSGVVRADDGSTLPGVNVTIKGTTNGTTTDENGKYTIQVPNDDAVLIYSFIGMEDQEVPVASQSNIDVGMVSGMVLDEVVVTALEIGRAHV